MKLVAISILLAAALIAGAILATRSPSEAEPALPVGTVPLYGPTMESTCMMAGGVWIDGEPDDTKDPTNGTCVQAPPSP